jgi:hypothetical protein
VGSVLHCELIEVTNIFINNQPKPNNMKKILITSLVAGALTVSAFGQGVFALTAGSGKIQFTTDGVTLSKSGNANPAQLGSFGQLNVSAFSAASGTQLTVSGGLPVFTAGTWFAATSTALSSPGPFAGSLAANNITLSATPGAPGAVEEVEIVAWSGTATSWAAALSSAGVGGQELLGFGGQGTAALTGALGYLITTGNSSVPGNDVTGTSGFNGLVLQPIPEPATMAIGGLGAAALLLFRRRK